MPAKLNSQQSKHPNSAQSSVRKSLGELAVGALDNADNDAKKSQGRAENFHDQDLDEQHAFLRIGQSTRSANDTNTDTAEDNTSIANREHKITKQD